MDKYGGCCTGNEEVFLLCEKVQKGETYKETLLINDQVPISNNWWIEYLNIILLYCTDIAYIIYSLSEFKTSEV